MTHGIKRYKLCKSCGKSKSVDDFYRRKNGYLSWLCKPCTTAQNNQLKAEKRRLAREARAALPPETTKACNKCGEVKSIEDDFHRYRKNSEKRVGICKKCAHEHMQANYAKPEFRERRYAVDAAYRAANLDRIRARNLKKYDITPEQYDHMYDLQNGRCAVCANEGPRFGSGADGGATRHNVLCVDHNHETHKVRGLLCHRCNRAIGLLGDDRLLMRAAIKYLRRSEDLDV